MKSKTRVLVECAMMVALATVLSLVKIYEAPLGGSVTLFSMVPLLVVSYRHGFKWGARSALVFSVLKILLGVGTISYVPTVTGIVLCVIFDYVFAYSAPAVAAFFRVKNAGSRKSRMVRAVLGALAACIFRFAAHFLSGAVVWYELTKQGEWNEYVKTVGMWTYSAVYNAQFMIPESILVLIAVPFVVIALEKIGRMGDMRMDSVR